MSQQQVSTPIADSIAYWQLAMKRTDDQHATFKEAANDLRHHLKVDAMVHPELNGAGQEAVNEALNAMAEEYAIADEARTIDEADQENEAEDDDAGDDEPRDGAQREKQSDILVSQAQSGSSLFHTPAPDHDEYADIVIDGRRQTHRVRGKGFRQWLRHQYYLKKKSGCSSEALQVAVETIATFAQIEGEEHEAHCRIARHEDAIYIDLGDETWRAIEVTAERWKVVDEPPVRFRRSPSTKALPMPQTGGGIQLLRSFCNVKGNDEFE
jgi:hypothetical protein